MTGSTIWSHKIAGYSTKGSDRSAPDVRFCKFLLKFWKLFCVLECIKTSQCVGTETGFQKVSLSPLTVSLGRKYPIPVSKIKYEVSRFFFRRSKFDREFSSIYRTHHYNFLGQKNANSARAT